MTSIRQGHYIYTMLLNDNLKKERTEMKKIRKDAKKLGLDFAYGYNGVVNSPRVNMDSIPVDEDGYKALAIDLGNGTSIKIGQTGGRVYVNVDEHRLTNMESLSIMKHKRRTYSADRHTGEFETTTLSATGRKVDVNFTTYHSKNRSLEPLEK